MEAMDDITKNLLEEVKNHSAKLDGFRNWEHYLLEKGLKSTAHLDLSIEFVMRKYSEIKNIALQELLKKKDFEIELLNKIIELNKLKHLRKD